jgi:hypothetical protein
MKHILNNLSEEEKNAIREQHAGGMKVITENFSKLLNSKLGDVKPLVNEQTSDKVMNVVAGTVGGGPLGGLIASANLIMNGAGTSDQKVKSLCALCKKTKAPITQVGNRMADAIRDSVQGMGTNEETINNVFASLRSFNDFCSLVNAYQASYSTDLYSDLDADIDSESEWVTIFRPIRNLLLKQKQQVVKPTPQTTQPPVPKPRPTGQGTRPAAQPGPNLARQQRPAAQPGPNLARQQRPAPQPGPNLARQQRPAPQPSQVRPSTTRPAAQPGPNLGRQQRPNYPTI